MLHCTIRTGRARAAVVIAAVAALSSAGQSNADPLFTIDLRVHETGGKTATVSNVGDLVTMDVFALFPNTDIINNDSLRYTVGSFLSSDGGLLGSLLSFNQSPGLQMFEAGTSTDLDNDGDLDVGGLNSEKADGFVYYASGLSWVPATNGSLLLGQLQFTAQSLTGGTDINWQFRNRLTGGLIGRQTNHFTADGVIHMVAGNSPLVGVGTPINISYVPSSNTQNYNVWNIDSAVSSGSGTNVANALNVGVSSAGTFTQSAGRTQALSLTVGAGAAGSLTQTGGALQFTTATIGAAGNGVVSHSSGQANYGSLVVSSQAGTSGTLNVSGDAEVAVTGNAVIGQSGPATYTQSGGDVAVADSVDFGNVTATVSGGTLNARALTLSGLSTVTQSGGVVSARNISMPKAAPSSTNAAYVLQAGELKADSLAPGATFRQTGGTSRFQQVSSTTIQYNTRMEIAGGNLNAALFRLGSHFSIATNTELLRQTGGTIASLQLDITQRGRYEMAGGTLAIEDRLSNGGVIDLSNAPVTMQFASGAFVDFAKYWGAMGTKTAGGQLLNAGNATITAGANSFINFPAGFDIDSIGSLASGGIVHVDGAPVVITAGRQLGGSGGIDGDVTNHGLISPGNSPGSLHIDGNFSQAASGSLMMEIGGTAAESFDLLAVSGSASLDGALQVALLDGFVPASSDVFTILTADSLDGIFANAPTSITLPEGTFSVAYSVNGVTLNNFSAVPEPASAALLAIAGLARLRRRRYV